MNELMRRCRALMGLSGDASPYEHGTWDDLFWHIDNGSYKRAYTIGEVLPLNAGSNGDINAQIVAFDADELADGSGKAPVTIIAKNLLNNNVSVSGSPKRWDTVQMRNYMRNTILPTFPESIRQRIVTVKKSSGYYNTSTSEYVSDYMTEDTIWAPSFREMRGGTTRETTGPIYSQIFTSNASRKKGKANAPDTASGYRLRTTNSTNDTFYVINNNGDTAANIGNSFGSGGCVGFCVG